MSFKELKIVSLTGEHLSEVVQIAQLSNLSGWSFSDYQNEILREDCFAYIVENNVDVSIGEAKSEPKILGFIITRLIKFSATVKDHNLSKKSKEIELLELENEFEIFNLAVRREYRGRGIGQMLFEKILDECVCNNVGSVWLEVRKTNESAIKFYRKNCFETVYVRKNYYYKPVDDALVMKMDLTQKRACVV